MGGALPRYLLVLVWFICGILPFVLLGDAHPATARAARDVASCIRGWGGGGEKEEGGVDAREHGTLAYGAWGTCAQQRVEWLQQSIGVHLKANAPRPCLRLGRVVCVRRSPARRQECAHRARLGSAPSGGASGRDGTGRGQGGGWLVRQGEGEERPPDNRLCAPFALRPIETTPFGVAVCAAASHTASMRCSQRRTCWPMSATACSSAFILSRMRSPHRCSNAKQQPSTCALCASECDPCMLVVVVGSPPATGSTARWPVSSMHMPANEGVRRSGEADDGCAVAREPDAVWQRTRAPPSFVRTASVGEATSAHGADVGRQHAWR